MAKQNRRIRYAVVGLGDIAQRAVLPAFKRSRSSELGALVSGEERKLKLLGRKYGVKNLYTYDQFDECLSSGEIDAVYIATPNTRHAGYAVRAAEAGIHVLCEKPMATTVDDCRRMTLAASQNGVQLMIAYRLHFEPANLEALRLVRSGKIGNPLFFSSNFGFKIEENNIRTDSSLGGGPVWDIGIYCINAARALFQADPLEVMAFAETATRDPRYSEIDETVSAMLRFPGNRLATFICSFGSESVDTLQIVGTEGDVVMETPYDWAEGKALELNRKGKTKRQKFKLTGQFEAELDAFSRCVIEGREPEPNGLEGWMDVQIILAIHESIQSRRPVQIPRLEGIRHPSPELKIVRPMHRMPDAVSARPPKDEAA